LLETKEFLFTEDFWYLYLIIQRDLIKTQKEINISVLKADKRTPILKKKMTEMAEKTVQTTGQTAEVETTENAKCKEILYSWMCCKSYNGKEIDIPEKPIGSRIDDP
jgi:putative transposon-encoded protein